MVYVADEPQDPPLGRWIYWKDGVGILAVPSNGDTDGLLPIADIDHVSAHGSMMSATAEVIANTPRQV